MKTVKKWMSINWLIACGYGLSITAVLTVLWTKLDSLVPGLSSMEVSQYGSSAMAKTILENPLYLPQKVLQLTGYLLGLDPVIALRGASTILGILTLFALYYVLKTWYSRRVAIFGAILLLSSDWFLHIVRHGSTAASYLSLMLALSCIVWIQKSRASTLSILIGTAVVIALLYTPGMVWFVAPLVLWRAKWILGKLRVQKPTIIALCIVSGLLALAPLALALVSHPEIVRVYLGFPETWPSVITIIKQITAVPFHIFVKSPPGYEYHLATLAYVGWFIGALFTIGIYAYFFQRKLDRTVLLSYILAVGTILIGLGGNVHIALLLPFIILVAAGGLALMLQQWFTVFPRNPFARNVGTVLMLLALGTASFYGINKYYVAWSNAPETKRLFQHKL
jgi:hypothetical protein